jgi:acyl-coenzyme A thioesterase 13
MNGVCDVVATRCFRTLLRPEIDLRKPASVKIAPWRVTNDFRIVPRRSGFLDLIGPLHVDDTNPRAPVYGLRVGDQHANSRGSVHGGVLTTLTDVALGYGTLAAHGEVLALVTASLTIDFTGTAGIGDWLEARTTLKRMGSRLAFASCEITTTSGRPVASSSGVFSVPPARPAAS